MSGETKVLKQEKNYLELEFVGGDPAVLSVVRDYAVGDKDVEFAGCTLEHPQLAHPKLILRSEKKDVSKIVADAVKKASKTFDSIRSGIKK